VTIKYSKHQTVVKVSLAVQKVGSGARDDLVVAKDTAEAKLDFWGKKGFRGGRGNWHVILKEERLKNLFTGSSLTSQNIICLLTRDSSLRSEWQWCIFLWRKQL